MKKIGTKWITDFSHIQEFAKYAQDKDTARKFLEAKRKCKEKLTHYLTTENPIRDNKGQIIDHSKVLDPSALFDMHIKRIHEYKRQLMNALHLIMLYQELKDNFDTRKNKKNGDYWRKSSPRI